MLDNNQQQYFLGHFFATNSIRKGATMEFIQESLCHSSIATTQLYFAGFEDDSKRKFAHNLMDF
jgi:site-specific recombinase XerD